MNSIVLAFIIMRILAQLLLDRGKCTSPWHMRVAHSQPFTTDTMLGRVKVKFPLQQRIAVVCFALVHAQVADGVVLTLSIVAGTELAVKQESDKLFVDAIGKE